MITRLTSIEPAKGNLLFVHGMCHGAWCWDQGFIQYFNDEGYNCYAINLAKHDQPGKTEGINKVSIDDYLQDVSNAISEIGEEVVLIGHSMGGFVVQKYLEEYRVKKAVLLASVPPSGILPAALRYLSNHISALPHFIIADIYAPFVKNAHILYHKDTNKTDIERYKQLMCAESFKVLLQMMFQPVRKKSKTPLLVLGGKDDQVISQKEVQRTGQFHGVETYIMDELGHNMMLDTSYSKVAQKIFEWL